MLRHETKPFPVPSQSPPVTSPSQLAWHALLQVWRWNAQHVKLDLFNISRRFLTCLNPAFKFQYCHGTVNMSVEVWHLYCRACNWLICLVRKLLQLSFKPPFLPVSKLLLSALLSTASLSPARESTLPPSRYWLLPCLRIRSSYQARKGHTLLISRVKMVFS